jgi:hypothetical protein
MQYIHGLRGNQLILLQEIRVKDPNAGFENSPGNLEAFRLYFEIL